MNTRKLDFGNEPEPDMEALALKRLKEAPTRRIFTIPVGHLSPEEAKRTVQMWRRRLTEGQYGG